MADIIVGDVFDDFMFCQINHNFQPCSSDFMHWSIRSKLNLMNFGSEQNGLLRGR